MILTRNGMGGFEFGKEFLSIAAFAPLGLGETLSDTLVRVGTCGDIEQSLVGLGVLHHSGRTNPSGLCDERARLGMVLKICLEQEP
jgi:hypothetical protein